MTDQDIHKNCDFFVESKTCVPSLYTSAVVVLKTKFTGLN
jgi:hypothetical protein